MHKIPHTRTPLVLGALLMGAVLSVGANQAVASDVEPAVHMALLDDDHSAPVVLAKNRYRYSRSYGRHNYRRLYLLNRNVRFLRRFSRGHHYRNYFHRYRPFRLR